MGVGGFYKCIFYDKVGVKNYWLEESKRDYEKKKGIWGKIVLEFYLG